MVREIPHAEHIALRLAMLGSWTYEMHVVESVGGNIARVLFSEYN